MLPRLCAVLLLSSVTAVSYADSLDLNLHSDAIRGTYTHNLQSDYKGLEADFGMLYSDDVRNTSETLMHVGLNVSGENWSDAGTFDIAIGGRLIYSSPGPYDAAAMSLGGRVRFSPVERFGIGGHVYYAPSITSFMDADSYSEWGVKVDYQLLPTAFAYIGYRKIKLNIDGGPDIEMDDNAHIGMQLLF